MYEPTSTLLVEESEVQPRDCQAAEADADDAADEEVDVLVAVEVVASVVDLEDVVVGAAVDVAAEVAEDAGMRASFWNTLILYPPPQTVFWPLGSPLHLTLHPSEAGFKLTADAGEHQHSTPYSTPAYGMPLAAHEAIQEPTVRLLEVYEPPPKARAVELSA
jgi:hypothetical protein